MLYTFIHLFILNQVYLYYRIFCDKKNHIREIISLKKSGLHEPVHLREKQGLEQSLDVQVSKDPSNNLCIFVF